MPRWGWTIGPWDQRAIATHVAVTIDVVEETLVLRVWDPVEPEREVARISLDPGAARKIGAQALLGASAAEWEVGARALERLLRERAAHPPPLPADDEVEVEASGPAVRTGRCPSCGDRALEAEEQPDPGARLWLGRCGARWTVAGDRVRELDPCPVRG